MNPQTDTSTIAELKEFWQTLFADKEPLPTDALFLTWSELHARGAVRHGIAKAAMKNLSMGGTMTLDHRIR